MKSSDVTHEFPILRIIKTGSVWTKARAPELLILSFLALLPFGEAIHIPMIIFLFVFILHYTKKEMVGIYHLRWYVVSCFLLILPLMFTLPVAAERAPLIQEIIRWSLYMIAGIGLLLWLNQRIHESLLVYGISGILLFWSVDALIQYGAGRNLFGFEYNDSRVTGIFHPNMRIGIMLAHWSPFLLEALRRYSQQSSALNRQWVWLLLIPVLIVILLSGSRAAWVVMIINLFVYTLYLIYRKYISWRLVLAAFFLVIACASIVFQSSPEMTKRFNQTLGLFSVDTNQRNEASSHRVVIWQDGWTIFQDNRLLGIGKGNVRLHLEGLEIRHGQLHDHMHFYGLDILVQTGLLGFSLYLTFIGIFITHWWRHVKQGNDLAVVAGLALFLMVMPINTHWGFYTLRSGSLIILFLAIAYGVFSHYYPTANSSSSRH